ncbi:alpha-amylase family glycosyl hydrolase, partial [Agathobacter sp.]|uniref:alpha-amylase family glycosyl hydrolase n=1 Tax=Agathobacter sp. TaxID=2021311 RepID=UPI003FD70919
QAVTISATTDTALGIKTLPITVTDQYGNKFSTTVDVEITDRVKKENDFDWDEAVVYFMMTDRFFDGNESNNTASGEDTYGKNPGLYHGGDFAGVTAKLDYLQDLGVNTIWITPIVENVKGVAVTGEGSDKVPYNAAYHGYWANDFTKLNPTLGTTKEFETMISEAHKRGMRIMVDIVVNHAGYGTESTFDKMLRDKSVNEGDIKSWQSDLPDFATENANVRAKLVEWQTLWMKNYGVDYFRVDTVKHVDSTTWAALKNSTTEVNPSFKMIGEYYGAGYASNGSTLGSGQMDADLDFDFNDQATSFVSGNISSVEKFLSARNSALNNSYMTGQFLSSHDEDGFKAALMKGKGYTKDQATSAALVAATLQLTAKGIPVIYYGEEVGLTGLNNYPYQTNRYDMDFSLATKDNVTYQHYKNLLSIRNAYTDVFARGSRTVVAGSDEEGYDVVSRSYGKTTLYVGMNIKDTAKEVKVPVSLAAGTKVKDLYSGATYTVGSDKTVAVTIPAAKDGGTVILAEENPGQQETTPIPTKKEDKATTTPAAKAAIDTKKAAPKSGDDNEVATYVCLLGLAMVAITAATYRKKRACK